MDYLHILSSSADKETVISEHNRLQAWVDQEKKGFLRYRIPFQRLRQYKAKHVDFTDDIVTIGDTAEVAAEERRQICEQLKQFMPWRKGPFSVFGIDIDAEWRSERKWQRVTRVLPDLAGKVIADIGCNNGYYMFRMAGSRPKFVLGFEPSVQHYYTFKALNAMAQCSSLAIDLLGVEHLPLFGESFDVVFLMGVIYHRPSPIDTLRAILKALKPGGTLILETQGIPGDEPYALFPNGTYAKAPGNYFIPTKTCLVNWLKKAGFINIDLFFSHPMSEAEQRRTEWMTFESFADYIDQNNKSLTVEGYPAPQRFFCKAEKKL